MINAIKNLFRATQRPYFDPTERFLQECCGNRKIFQNCRFWHKAYMGYTDHDTLGQGLAEPTVDIINRSCNIQEPYTPRE